MYYCLSPINSFPRLFSISSVSFHALTRFFPFASPLALVLTSFSSLFLNLHLSFSFSFLLSRSFILFTMRFFSPSLASISYTYSSSVFLFTLPPYFFCSSPFSHFSFLLFFPSSYLSPSISHSRFCFSPSFFISLVSFSFSLSIPYLLPFFSFFFLVLLINYGT